MTSTTLLSVSILNGPKKATRQGVVFDVEELSLVKKDLGKMLQEVNCPNFNPILNGPKKTKQNESNFDKMELEMIKINLNKTFKYCQIKMALKANPKKLTSKIKYRGLNNFVGLLNTKKKIYF